MTQLPLPSEVARRLSAGAAALVPRHDLEALRDAYPASRIEPFDPGALAGLDPMDVVVVEGPLASALLAMRAIHLTLRPGGILLWRVVAAAEALLAEAGFLETRREAGAWIARRSTR